NSQTPFSYRCDRSPTTPERRSGSESSALQNRQDTRQCRGINVIVDHDATPAHQHDLDPTRRHGWARGSVFRCFDMFLQQRKTARRGLTTDHRLYKRRGIVGLGETPFFRQTTPSEQLARRQAVPPRRRRYNPRHAIAFRHDPLLFYQRPAPPRTCRDHIEPRNLRHRRMVSHTPMSSSKDLNRQGGPRRRDTTLQLSLPASTISRGCTRHKAASPTPSLCISAPSPLEKKPSA